MIKNISETRKDYEYSYWLIRARGFDVYHDFPPFPVTTIEDCAVLSYENSDSRFSGWINRQRMSRFTRAKQRYLDGERLLF